MKPLGNPEPFLERFDNFKDTEIRAIEIISPLQMNVTLTAQDSARGYDWLTITLECNGITDAQLVDNTKLAFLDMQDGITILKDENGFSFALGQCYNDSAIKSASLYIICNSIKYEEGSF